MRKLEGKLSMQVTSALKACLISRVKINMNIELLDGRCEESLFGAAKLLSWFFGCRCFGEEQELVDFFVEVEVVNTNNSVFSTSTPTNKKTSMCSSP